MVDPREFQFNLPLAGRAGKFPLLEKIHPAAWAAATHCTSARPADPIASMRAIVIHATAGASTDGAISVMLDGRASFHWVISGENEAAHDQFVWASAPEARAAWHVRNNCFHKDVCGGANRINDWSLGIELVNTQKSEDSFSPWQIRACAEIVRYAWAKYPGLSHVVSHARLDPSRRSDPGINFPWDDLRRQVLGVPAP